MMKTTLVLACLFSLNILAQSETCSYSQKKLTKFDTDRYSNDVSSFINEDKYGDDWACVMKKRHLKRDSLKNCFPETISSLSVPSKRLIQGKVKYMGLFSEPYKYEVSQDADGKILIEVRIHFTKLGLEAESLKITKEKLAYASELWSSQSPEKMIKFSFTAVSAEENPHFTVKLAAKTPGTKFNSIWGITNSKNIVAHEVGHMLGLDDEYSVVRTLVWEIKNEVDTRMCNLRSIMCDPYESRPTIYPYVYYVILRRLGCEA